MLFVALVTVREGQYRAALERRAAWSCPPQLRIIAEPWLINHDFQAVAVFECDDLDVLAGEARAWSELVEVTLLPALSPEEGARLAAERPRIGMAATAMRFARLENELASRLGRLEYPQRRADATPALRDAPGDDPPEGSAPGA